ncbi:hypothetical protein [Brevibacterium aurantiacum]|uniref:Uncharacterized protein n=1 Tax=Brevibacterium aurantiacum TaxID=273384 RepID=A0A556C5Q5_BREAU|nr:hypothetical protein [Brevibacterium aurantiacum]TSI12646.1 hypothetical protein FO013_19420 [Brevibacterium aurantiacum]
MTTENNRPGIEVPEPDWSEQLIDDAMRLDAESLDEPELGADTIREADPGDIAEQTIGVEIDDEDGYDESAPI